MRKRVFSLLLVLALACSLLASPALAAEEDPGLGPGEENTGLPGEEAPAEPPEEAPEPTEEPAPEDPVPEEPETPDGPAPDEPEGPAVPEEPDEPEEPEEEEVPEPVPLGWAGWPVTGDWTTDLISCALAQTWRTAFDLGLEGEWCVSFLVSCGLMAAPEVFEALRGDASVYMAVLHATGKDVGTFFAPDAAAAEQMASSPGGRPDNCRTVSAEEFAPQAGDLVCLGWSSGEQVEWTHMALIYAVTEDTIYVVSGNAGSPDGSWETSVVMLGIYLPEYEGILGFLRLREPAPEEPAPYAPGRAKVPKPSMGTNFIQAAAVSAAAFCCGG